MRPLIIITDRDGREDLLAQILNKHGVSIYAIVLRSVKDVQSSSEKLQQLCREHGVLLIAHSKTENIKYCDGIHLNLQSKTIESVRAEFGDQLVIGYSAHSAAEAKIALHKGANYVFLSPVFKSKDNLSSPLGASIFNDAAEELGQGIYALGGIDSNNVATLSKKAGGFGCISAIFQSPDPLNEVDLLLKAF